jgi:hypothetical protein
MPMRSLRTPRPVARLSARSLQARHLLDSQGVSFGSELTQGHPCFIIRIRPRALGLLPIIDRTPEARPNRARNQEGENGTAVSKRIG